FTCSSSLSLSGPFQCSIPHPDLSSFPTRRSSDLFGLPNPRVDLADAFAARARRAHPNAPPNLDFQHIADSLGVPVLGRHSALGDAVTVGLCWLALQAARGSAPGQRGRR